MITWLQNIWVRIENEPVVVSTLVGAIITVLVVFGVPITDEQKTALVALTVAVCALFARSKVSPV